MARAYVRFTDDALEDLRGLHRKDPQIVRAILKKCLLLERDPEAGEPLLGNLIGFRKLVVGDRDWRIVWRVASDTAGDVTLDIAELWAAGARADAEVYQEITDRLTSVDDDVLRHTLGDVVGLLAGTSDISPASEPIHDPVPKWLRERLIHTAQVDADAVDAMAGEEAMRRWEQYMTHGT